MSANGAGPAHRARLSDDLLQLELRGAPARTRVILHGSRAEVQQIAARHGISIVRWLADGAVVRANGPELTRMAMDTAISHLSGDQMVRAAMQVSNTSTAADQTWAGSAGLLLGIGGISGVTGKGIGIAVVDSGIALHSALARKVAANVSFVTGDPSVDDAFGHGTHVAGIIAGTAAAATSVTPLFTGGVAPGAHLINVRVLGDDGAGYTSDVIAGIDWVVQNRALYNIRIINLSLGTFVNQPAALDPLCEAVARAYRAGIVVVASAGNAGRTATGAPILGGITSPGNSPFAITVGALTTQATISRRDDAVAPYSSRGPTKYDLTVKPDLAAPGNRIVSLEAAGAYLATNYPALHRAGTGTNAYMQLSGSSMAAPIVSGAAALLLQGTPGLGTNQVKLALQAGATYVRDGGLMGAGAGSLNIWASRRIASQGLGVVTSSLVNTLVGGVLTESSGASFWDSGTLGDRAYSGVGIRLLSQLDLPRVWSNVGLLHFGDLNLVGLLNPLNALPRNELIWGTQVMSWANYSDDQLVWGTAMWDDSGDQLVWGTYGDDQLVWGTSVLTGQ